jgi:hypothetical protein
MGHLMHPVFALAIVKLQALEVEAQTFAKADTEILASLAAGDESKAYVAKNSRASSIESIYTGIEAILKQLLMSVDEHVFAAKAEDQHRWHAQLLAQAALETEFRPAIITTALYKALEELRKFRHLERNIYGHSLIAARVAELAALSLEAAEKFQSEAHAFIIAMSDNRLAPDRSK